MMLGTIYNKGTGVFSLLCNDMYRRRNPNNQRYLRRCLGVTRMHSGVTYAADGNTCCRSWGGVWNVGFCACGLRALLEGDVRAQSFFPSASGTVILAAYSEGTTPNRSRKARAKCDRLMNPTS